ncbi:MAG: alpha/beta hydrolase [Bacteroidota bacterium]
MTFQEWQSKGKSLKVNGIDVFFVDEGKADETLVVLHGYPTCSYDYWRILPQFSEKYRVIIHDHPGFGLSGKPIDYTYSLVDQADIALNLWRQLDIRSAHILAHDYGTSVATEIIARRNFGIEPVKILSATLGNGSMLIEMSKLRLVQKLLLSPLTGNLTASLMTRNLFKRNMRNIWADPKTVDDQEMDVLWEMINYGDGISVFPKITQYIKERYRLWHRWIGGLEKTDLPVNLVWADKDPVAVIGMAYRLDKLIRDTRLQVIEGVGHYPMLESPEIYVDAVLSFLKNPRFDNHQKTY